MTYKGMLLSALLVPVAVTSYGKSDIDQKIQQLKEAHFQKELELSDIGAKIAEKQQLLEEMYDDVGAIIRERYKSLKLEGEERLERGRQIDAENDAFEDSLKRAIEDGVVKAFIIKELFNEEANWNLGDFEAVKFWVIRDFCEGNLLKTLVDLYATCLQELSDVDKEIELLKK